MGKETPKKQQSPQPPMVTSNLKRNFIVLIFGLIGAFFFGLSRKMGLLTTLQNYPENPNCTFHERQIIGPEDMTKIRENIAIGIANDNIQLWDMGGVKETPRGKIWLYYFDTKTTQILEAENYSKDTNFFPHGIFFDPKTERLHVLNHPYEGLGDRIEVFQLDTQDISNIKISLVDTYQFPEYLNGNANDIIFIGNQEYIVTQWIAYPDDLNDSRRTTLAAGLNKLKSLFNMGFNQRKTQTYSCVFNDDKKMDCVVIKSTSGDMNNGISWDLKDQVFVADSIGKRIAVFTLDQQAERSERLKFQENIRTNCHPDNIEYDRFLNQILAGGFGKAYQYFTTLASHTKVHPQYPEKIENLWSLVDRIKFEGDNKYSVENILTRDDVYRGLSVALEYQGQYITGSFMDKSILTCDIKGINPNQPHTHSVISFFKSLISKIIPI